VKIGAAQIEVDRGDMLASLRKRNRKARGNEAFADAAFSAPNRPDLLRGFGSGPRLTE
jgi:hypothetical protein